MLHFSSAGKNEHLLAAKDTARQGKTAAYLMWGSSKPGTGYEPGEVGYVSNQAGKRQARARGLGGALFHSAHYFNFGQSTVPIHSMIRTEEGEHFASKVRPELRPHIRYDSESRRLVNLAGERTSETQPKWDLPEDLHPYQQEKTRKQQAVAAKMRKGRPTKAKGQGSLF
jgi:hypothetical protein